MLAAWQGSADSKLAGLYNNRHFVPCAFDIAITTACLSARPWLRSHGKHNSPSVEQAAATKQPIKGTDMTDYQRDG